MTTDIRIYLYTESMNKTQRDGFIECVEKIDANRWRWEFSFIADAFQVWDGQVLLGEGHSLQHAMEAAESAR